MLDLVGALQDPAGRTTRSSCGTSKNFHAAVLAAREVPHRYSSMSLSDFRVLGGMRYAEKELSYFPAAMLTLTAAPHHRSWSF